jgi:hypothetical protein
VPDTPPEDPTGQPPSTPASRYGRGARKSDPPADPSQRTPGGANLPAPYGPPAPPPGYGPPGYGPPPQGYGPPGYGPPAPAYGQPPVPVYTAPPPGERPRRPRDRRRGRFRRRLVALLVVIVAIWLALKSCSGPHGPGIGSLNDTPGGPVTSVPGGPVIHTNGPSAGDVPAEDLANRAKKAAQAAASYHLKGNADLSSTGPITVDLTLTGDQASGTIAANGHTIQVSRDKLTYRYRPAGSANWVAGDTADLPGSGPLNLRPLLDAGHWIVELIPTPEAATAAAVPEKLGDRMVTRIRLRGGEYLYVAATGTPYPVKLSNPDGPNPNLTFDGWR